MATLYRGTIPTIPATIAADDINHIHFDQIIFAEIAPKGAMGNEGGIILKVEDDFQLKTYTANIFEDEYTFTVLEERLNEASDLFDSWYGGMGNYMLIKKHANLEIDEQEECFWYRSGDTKYKIECSVLGVFLSVVEEMKGGSN